MLKSKPSFPKHFWPVELRFGCFRKRLPRPFVITLTSDRHNQLTQEGNKSDSVLERACILEPRNVRILVVLPGVSPYLCCIAGLPKIIKLPKSC